jgi:urease accessory protein
VGFAVRDGAARLVHLHQCAPLRVLLPYAADGDIPTAAIANTGGGVLAGDRNRVTIEAGCGARVLAMPQAAEKVYRSEGPTAEIETRLSVDAGGWLEWLPQETIVFQDARFRRATTLSLHREARAMAGEILVFGRIAHGERTTRGLVREAWQVRRDGELVWADALHLEGEFGATMSRPVNFDGAAAVATFVYGAPGAADRLDFARATLDETAGPGVRAGMTSVAGLLVGRWLAADALALRRAFGAFWAAFRHAVAGLPQRLPALWHV